MDQKVNTIGCWRAHLNVLQKMVRENVATALVFEDDADWDVSLKHQLVQFARGSRYISNTTDPEFASSPYGDNWDLLWIGHCGTWYHEEDYRRFFVIPKDPTVEPPSHRDNVDEPDMSRWEGGPSGDNRTRIVFHSNGGVCTAAYAISQQGARKALYHVSLFISVGVYGILCFATRRGRQWASLLIPPLFHSGPILLDQPAWSGRSRMLIITRCL